MTQEKVKKDLISNELLMAICASFLMGLLVVMIVLPRPVHPQDLLLPANEFAALRSAEAHDRSLVKLTENDPLSIEIRSIGSAFIGWNMAAHRSLSSAGPRSLSDAQLREEKRQAIRDALGFAMDKLKTAALDEGLKRLRALHTERFVHELEESKRAHTPTRALTELAGGLLPVLRSHGWLTSQFEAKVPLLVLRTRFKLYWTSTLYQLGDCERTSVSQCYGVTTLPIAPSELRAFLVFLLHHPVISLEERTHAKNASHACDTRRLLYLDRMVALDRYNDATMRSRLYTHGLELEELRAVLLFRVGRYRDAEQLFAQISGRKPHDMRWKNWRLAAASFLRG